MATTKLEDNRHYQALSFVMSNQNELKGIGQEAATKLANAQGLEITRYHIRHAVEFAGLKDHVGKPVKAKEPTAKERIAALEERVEALERELAQMAVDGAS